MDPSVAMAVLAASLLHAAWHALVKTSGDRVVALAGMNLVSASAALAFLPFVSIPKPLVLAVIGSSVLLHAGYKLALARLYLRTELSQAYPLARGFTPLIAVLLAAVTLGEIADTRVLAGVGLVSLGLILLVFEKGPARLSLQAVGIAALTGGAVAAYTVVDAYGIRQNGDWLSFTVWLVAADGLVFVMYALLTRGQLAIHAWRGAPVRTLVSGLLGLASFGVFMWALGRSQVGAVAALRETSVIFAALIGAWFLNERAGLMRYLAATLVASGVAVVSFLR